MSVAFFNAREAICYELATGRRQHLLHCSVALEQNDFRKKLWAKWKHLFFFRRFSFHSKMSIYANLFSCTHWAQARSHVLLVSICDIQVSACGRLFLFFAGCSVLGTDWRWKGMGWGEPKVATIWPYGRLTNQQFHFRTNCRMTAQGIQQPTIRLLT